MMNDKKYNSTAVWFSWLYVAASIAVILFAELPMVMIAYGASGLWAGYYLGVCQPKKSEGDGEILIVRYNDEYRRVDNRYMRSAMKALIYEDDDVSVYFEKDGSDGE